MEGVDAQQWSTSLFGCFEDCGICLYGLFCLPCLFGHNAVKVRGVFFQTKRLCFAGSWNRFLYTLLYVLLLRCMRLLRGSTIPCWLPCEIQSRGEALFRFLCSLFFPLLCYLSRSERTPKKRLNLEPRSKEISKLWTLFFVSTNQWATSKQCNEFIYITKVLEI